MRAVAITVALALATGCTHHKPVAYAYGGTLVGLGTYGLVDTAVRGGDSGCDSNQGLCLDAIGPYVAAVAVAVGLTIIVLTAKAESH